MSCSAANSGASKDSINCAEIANRASSMRHQHTQTRHALCVAIFNVHALLPVFASFGLPVSVRKGKSTLRIVGQASAGKDPLHLNYGLKLIEALNSLHCRCCFSILGMDSEIAELPLLVVRCER